MTSATVSRPSKEIDTGGKQWSDDCNEREKDRRYEKDACSTWEKIGCKLFLERKGSGSNLDISERSVPGIVALYKLSMGSRSQRCGSDVHVTCQSKPFADERDTMDVASACGFTVGDEAGDLDDLDDREGSISGTIVSCNKDREPEQNQKPYKYKAVAAALCWANRS